MQKGDVAMLKWLSIIGFIFAFVLLPQVRYTCFHLPLVFYNAVIDTYKYFKYKKYNEYRGYVLNLITETGRVICRLIYSKQFYNKEKVK